MSASFPPGVPSLQRLASRLARLPGVGPRSAERIAYHILRIPRGEVLDLAQSLKEVLDRVGTCSTCFTLTEKDPCGICADGSRDRTSICVVQDCQDVQALERSGVYRGLYHVLGGVLSPLEGIGPDDLTIEPLMKRLEGVREVVIATSPTVEGEATASYLAKILKTRGVEVSKMARGLPMGGSLEFIDDVTLGEALKGRKNV